MLEKKAKDKEIQDLKEKITCAQETMIDLVAKAKSSTLLNNHYKNIQSNLDLHYNLRLL